MDPPLAPTGLGTGLHQTGESPKQRRPVVSDHAREVLKIILEGKSHNHHYHWMTTGSNKVQLKHSIAAVLLECFIASDESRLLSKDLPSQWISGNHLLRNYYVCIMICWMCARGSNVNRQLNVKTWNTLDYYYCNKDEWLVSIISEKSQFHAYSSSRWSYCQGMRARK